MIGAGSAHRRMSRVWRLLIGLQVSLLVFALVAPAGTMAADPIGSTGLAAAIRGAERSATARPVADR